MERHREAARLEFAVRFAQMDLDALRPGDWLNLRDDLAGFLGVKEGARMPNLGGIMAMPITPPFPAEFSAEDFRTLQTEVHAILHDMVRQRTDNPHLSAGMVKITGTYWLSNLDTLIPHAGYHLLHVMGPTRDMVLLVLLHLLSGPADKLLRCPECDTLFCRNKKQQYCSRQCVNKATLRKWRATERGKAQERERSRTRYRARIKQQTGGNVIVKKARKGGSEDAETSRE